MARLTLYEAMAVVMHHGGWMDLDQVAREIAEHNLYLRPKDGLPPPTYQLGMRVRKYPDWFEARGPAGRRSGCPRRPGRGRAYSTARHTVRR